MNDARLARLDFQQIIRKFKISLNVKRQGNLTLSLCVTSSLKILLTTTDLMLTTNKKFNFAFLHTLISAKPSQIHTETIILNLYSSKT